MNIKGTLQDEHSVVSGIEVAFEGNA